MPTGQKARGSTTEWPSHQHLGAAINGLHWALGAGAGAVGLLSNIPYFRSIIRGGTRPSRVACIISVVIGAATLAGMVAIGAGAGAVLPGVFLAGNLVTLVLSFKHGADASSKVTYLAAGCALLAVIMWIVLGPHWAIAMAALANLSSYVETWLKQRQFKNSENITAWVMSIMASALSFAAIMVLPVPHWIVLVPSILTVVCASVVVVIATRQRNASRALHQTA